jgi:hypothetical protein
MFLKNVIFWSYGRGTLPYDILCALILIFIFATPSSVFQDWPRVNAPQQFQTGHALIQTRDHLGNVVYNVRLPAELMSVEPAVLNQNIQWFLEKYLKKHLNIARTQPIYGGDGKIVGFSVWTDDVTKISP